MPRTYHRFEVLKIHKTKFFCCPNSAITGASWDLLRQVNLCSDPDGNIRHLPEPELSILDQSPRFLAAVGIVKQERNSDWYHEMITQRAKESAHG